MHLSSLKRRVVTMVALRFFEDSPRARSFS
jgi:hypothetical protein